MMKIITILKEFHLKGFKIIPWKLGFLCYTDKGVFYLKKSDYSEEQLRFAQEAKKHLVNRGFEDIDLFIESNGNPYFKDNKELYVLTKWIPGRKIQGKIEDLMGGMEHLALFHEASKGFLSSENSQQSYTFQNTLIKRWEDLIYVKNLIKMKTIKNKIDLLLLDNIDLLIDLSITAVKNLQDRGYFTQVERERKEKFFIHGNYYGNNLIINSKFYLIGFEKARVELRVLDIAYFINDIMKNSRWNIDLTKKMIQVYDKNRGFEKEEINIISNLLLFPQELWRFSTMYYFKEYQWVKGSAFYILKNELENLYKKLTFIEKYNKVF